MKKFIDDHAERIMKLIEERGTVQWKGATTQDKIRSCNIVYWNVREHLRRAVEEGKRSKHDELFPPCSASNCDDQEGGRCVSESLPLESSPNKKAQGRNKGLHDAATIARSCKT